jgi:hypothetical protein
MSWIESLGQKIEKEASQLIVQRGGIMKKNQLEKCLKPILG